MASIVTNESLRWQLRLAKDVLDAQEAEIERLLEENARLRKALDDLFSDGRIVSIDEIRYTDNEEKK